MSTIYLTTLNKSRTLTGLAEATGATPPIPVTNSTTISGKIYDLAMIQQAFRFYTTAAYNDNFPSNMNDILNANFEVIAKNGELEIFQTAAASPIDPWVPNAAGNNEDLRTAYNEVLFGLAKAMFGSAQAVDFLSNSSDVMLEVSNIIWDCVHDNNIDATQNVVLEATNFLLKTYPTRFELRYNAIFTSTPTSADESKFLALTVIGSSGARATVDVTCSAEDTVSVISVTSGSGVETPFVAGEAIKITDSYGGSNVDISFVLDAATATDLTLGTNAQTGFATLIGSLTNTVMITDEATLISVKAQGGMYTGLKASAAVSGAEAEVTVQLTTKNSIVVIASISVTGTTAQAKSGVSTPFALGEIVTIPCGSYTLEGTKTSNIITIGVGTGPTLTHGINTVATAMLNGTLSETEESIANSLLAMGAVPLTGTGLPFEANDTIGTFITISSNSEQTDMNHRKVSSQYVAQYEYVIQASGTTVTPARPTVIAPP